jgi:hypothetical protein
MYAVLERSSILKDLYEEGTIGLAAGMYAVESGEVEILDTLMTGGPAGATAHQALTAR